nr:hypothetical protein [uncultured Acetatifactor sp.]
MKAGDKVKWKSQSQGSWVEKIGTVVADVPAGTNAKQYAPDLAKKSHFKFDDVSKVDRVLVAVPAGKDGKITHYYCPRRSVLVAQWNEED